MSGSNTEEIWKDVLGYEGLYRVSNLGRVWSIYYDKELFGCPDKNGYLRVGITKNKIGKTVKIHRIVCSTFNFVEGWELLEVNHINAIKTDNRSENLEFVSTLENNRHARALGLITPPKGFNHYNSVMTPDRIDEIVELYESGLNIRQIAKQMRLNVGAVGEFLNGVNYAEEYSRVEDRIILEKERRANVKVRLQQLKAEEKKERKSFDIPPEVINNILEDYFEKFLHFDDLCSKYRKDKTVIDFILSSIPKDSPRRINRLKSGQAYQAGTKNGRAKLSPEQVLKIIDRVEQDGLTVQQVGKEFRIARAVVYKILQGKLWQSVTGRVHIDL